MNLDIYSGFLMTARSDRRISLSFKSLWFVDFFDVLEKTS